MKQLFTNQPVFVVETNGHNEPGDVAAPFAGFVANKEDADSMVNLQESWGLTATVKEMRGDVEIDVDGDDITVSMKLRPVV